jgi:hypothetical protein
MNRRLVMQSFFLIGVTTATAAALAISPLQASEHEITSQEVEAYFQQVQDEATDIVRAGELHRIVEWIDEHFADDAVLQANMTIVAGEERKGFLSMTLDKGDLTVVGGAFAGPFGQMEFEDFSLEVEVSTLSLMAPALRPSRADGPSASSSPCRLRAKAAGPGPDLRRSKKWSTAPRSCSALASGCRWA